MFLLTKSGGWQLIIILAATLHCNWLPVGMSSSILVVLTIHLTLWLYAVKWWALLQWNQNGHDRPKNCVLLSDLEKVAITQSVIWDTKTPQVPAGDTFWLAWINFLGLVTHIIIRDEKIKGICTCFHHIYTIMCLVHQIGLLCMVFVFWYQIMSRITLFFGQIFVANQTVLVTHFNP